MRLEDLSKEQMKKLFEDEVVIAGARQIYFRYLGQDKECDWKDALFEYTRTINQETKLAAREVHTLISKYGVMKLEEKITKI